jgi:hypothetical protein
MSGLEEETQSISPKQKNWSEKKREKYHLLVQIGK